MRWNTGDDEKGMLLAKEMAEERVIQREIEKERRAVRRETKL